MKIFQGDCVQVLKQLEDNSIDMILTDPPYRVISGGNKNETAGWIGSVLGKNDGKIFKYNDIKLEEWIPEVYRILKNGSHFYTMTNVLNLENTLKICREVGFGLHNILIWKKNNQVLNRWYMKSVEYILFFYKKPAKKINIIGTSQVLEFNNPRNKKHPTEKPVELMKVMINNSSKDGDIILDPFAGSGTTGVACKNLNRDFILIEKEPEYIKIIEARTGIKAEVAEIKEVKTPEKVEIKEVKSGLSKCCNAKIIKGYCEKCCELVK